MKSHACHMKRYNGDGNDHHKKYEQRRREKKEKYSIEFMIALADRKPTTTTTDKSNKHRQMR